MMIFGGCMERVEGRGEVVGREIEGERSTDEE